MNIGLNAVETMALALVLLMVGIQLRRRVEWLERMCVPTPVVGGIGFAVLVWLLRSMDVLTLDLDTSVHASKMTNVSKVSLSIPPVFFAKSMNLLLYSMNPEITVFKLN